MLIILSGLPGSGKTTVSRKFAEDISAVHIRIDTIETALVRLGVSRHALDAQGYMVGYAVAEDNLKLGHTVVADSVNPVDLSRNAWRGVAARAHVTSVDVEIICSDADEHRVRVETRESDIARLHLPSWEDVRMREYEPWTRNRLVIDTAGRKVEDCVEELHRKLDSHP